MLVLGKLTLHACTSSGSMREKAKKGQFLLPYYICTTVITLYSLCLSNPLCETCQLILSLMTLFLAHINLIFISTNLLIHFISNQLIDITHFFICMIILLQLVNSRHLFIPQLSFEMARVLSQTFGYNFRSIPVQFA